MHARQALYQLNHVLVLFFPLPLLSPLLLFLHAVTELWTLIMNKQHITTELHPQSQVDYFCYCCLLFKMEISSVSQDWPLTHCRAHANFMVSLLPQPPKHLWVWPPCPTTDIVFPFVVLIFSGPEPHNHNIQSHSELKGMEPRGCFDISLDRSKIF